MAIEPTVYVVDDQDEARMSVCALARSMGLRAESFSSAEEFLQGYSKGQPGCLVTDVWMHGMNGLDLQERLRERNIPIPVVLLTAFAETPLAVQAMKHGAVTLLEKPCEKSQLCESIREALDRDVQRRADMETRQEYRRRLATLSSAEREVLDLVVGGVPNREIAKRLGKNLRAVEECRGAIFAKTQVDSVIQLARLVMIAEPNACPDSHSKSEL